jgi:hypothetical protein
MNITHIRGRGAPIGKHINDDNDVTRKISILFLKRHISDKIKNIDLELNIQNASWDECLFANFNRLLEISTAGLGREVLWVLAWNRLLEGRSNLLISRQWILHPWWVAKRVSNDLQKAPRRRRQAILCPTCSFPTRKAAGVRKWHWSTDHQRGQQRC